MSNDWNKLVFSFEYSMIALDGYPDWHINPETKEPYNLYKTFVGGDNHLSSHSFACKLDDIVDGQFYYRDFTKSGIPIVKDGEEYNSIFVFQYKSDYLKAKKEIGV